MFKCDSVRVVKFPGKVFLIIGWNRNTKQDSDSGQWMKFEDGGYKPIDFDYLDEQVVVSARNEAELLRNSHRRRVQPV
jgi:hypothetical protein